MPRLLLVASFVLLLSFATSAAPVPKHLMPKDPPFAVPTRVGTKWLYDRQGTDVTLIITKVEDKDGAKLVTTEWVGEGGKHTPHMVVSVSEKGLFLLAECGEPYDTPWCIFKLPHREGEVWDCASSRGNRIRTTGKRIAGPIETVKTGTGSIEAARVDWEFVTRPNQRAFKATYWYANGIGLVRLDNDLVLKSFTPGKE